MAHGVAAVENLPEIAALGADRLNAYCQEWLVSPVAKELAVTAIHVGDDLRFHPTVKLSHDFQDGEEVIMPVNEILYYIVDRHFEDAQLRNSLHQRINENRLRSGNAGRIYRADLGEKFTLYLTCKNPECQAVLRTPLKGYLGVQYTCEPTEASSLKCGSTYTYDGGDLHFVAAFPT